MAIEISNNGTTERVASSAQGSLGVALGAIGTGLGALNSGLLGGNGLFGNGLNGTANAVMAGTEALNGIKEMGKCCFVDKDVFWSTILQQANDQAARDLSAERRMSSIEAAVSQNAAVSDCNKNAIRREIEVTNDKFDMTISNERVVNELILKNALCRVPQGDVYLSPTKLADNYIAPSRVLDSYVPRDYLPGRGFYGAEAGTHNPYGFGGGCVPCGGYYGF